VRLRNAEDEVILPLLRDVKKVKGFGFGAGGGFAP